MKRCSSGSVEHRLYRAAAALALGAAIISGMPFAARSAAETSVYQLKWRGETYRLSSDTQPDAYLDGCEHQGANSVASPTARRSFCLKLMLVWGENLVTHFGSPLAPKDPVADGLGAVLVKRTFERLREDLAGLTGPRLAEELVLHGDLDMRIEWAGPMGAHRATLAAPAVNYYLSVWQGLPEFPDTFPAFLQKYQAGEELKTLLLLSSYPTEVPLKRALDFYQSAARFHSMPPPDIAGQADKAGLRVNLGSPGLLPAVGYARLPGTRGLFPAHDLAADDLARGEALLRNAKLNGLMDPGRADALLDENYKQATSHEVDWITRWIQRLEQRKDRYGVVVYRSRMRELYAQSGDLKSAMEEEKKICALLAELGEAEEGAQQAVVLAGYWAQMKQWQEVLRTLAGVDEGLSSMARYEDLERALDLEKKAQTALGLADSTAAWTPRLNALGEDLASWPGVMTAGNDSNEDKVRNNEVWLSNAGHAEGLRTVTKMQLANAYQALHRYTDAQRVAKEVVVALRRQNRKVQECKALGALLAMESKGGQAGEFYAGLDRYEDVCRELYGEDWVQAEDGYDIARVLYELGDVHRAAGILDRQMEQEQLRAIWGERLAWGNEADAVSDAEHLLRARIDLETGRRDDAEEIIAAISAGDRRKSPRVVLQLAEMDRALGNYEPALNKLQVLADRSVANPVDDLGFWSEVTLERAKAQLAMGQDPRESVARFEELAPHFARNPDLEAARAVDMEIFLSDYYVARGNGPKAEEWLRSGLALAEQLGLTDQQIEIHRKLGGRADSKGDCAGAVEEYRTSIRLMDSISPTIPSDLGKVGYRGQRNAATPLLVIALYREYQRTHDARLVREIWATVEDGKSRALTESVLAEPNASMDKPDLERVQKALGEDGELLEYYMPENAGDAVLRFRMDRTQLSVEMLPATASDIGSQVDALKAEVEASADSYDDLSFRKHCSELGRALLPRGWEGFEFTRPKQVFIVPAGALYLFPFSLLADGQGRFLDENAHVQITYLPNATMLLRRTATAGEARHWSAFINPGRDEEHTSFLDSDPELRQEFEKVLQKWDARVYWQEPFTAHELIVAARDSENVFVYAHGRFIPDDPVSSYIRLSDDGGTASMLSADEIIRSKLGHGLWVIAACSTGSGKVRSGDEVLGLPRAILQAGASMVVIPLWEVHVSSSWRLITQFYGNLAAGMPVAEALHAAQSKQRAENAPPYDWAPFILVGQNGYRNQD